MTPASSSRRYRQFLEKKADGAASTRKYTNPVTIINSSSKEIIRVDSPSSPKKKIKFQAFPAKYPGTCFRCGDTWEKGDLIMQVTVREKNKIEVTRVFTEVKVQKEIHKKCNSRKNPEK